MVYQLQLYYSYKVGTVATYLFTGNDTWKANKFKSFWQCQWMSGAAEFLKMLRNGFNLMSKFIRRRFDKRQLDKQRCDKRWNLFADDSTNGDSTNDNWTKYYVSKSNSTNSRRSTNCRHIENVFLLTKCRSTNCRSIRDLHYKPKLAVIQLPCNKYSLF